MISNPAIIKKLVDLQVITAEQAESFGEADIVRAIDGLHQALVIVQKNNEVLMAENTEFQAKVKDVKTSEAKKFIELACEQGKIPSKDTAIVQFYTEQYIQNPELTKKVVDAMSINSVLNKVVKVTTGDNTTVVATRGGGSMADLVQAQHLVVNEIRAANPNMSYSDAFNKAKREHPENFPAEV